jgi:hypothetical protein
MFQLFLMMVFGPVLPFLLALAPVLFLYALLRGTPTRGTSAATVIIDGFIYGPVGFVLSALSERETHKTRKAQPPVEPPSQYAYSRAPLQIPPDPFAPKKPEGD